MSDLYSKEMWNSKFSAEEYVYGEKPNEFFRQRIDGLRPGKLLLPAEGEGRNAVYAAKKGWQVTAFDISEAGKAKALKLADAAGVSFDYIISAAEDFDYPCNEYDLIALIYSHFKPEIRTLVHRKLQTALKENGKIILEVFNKKQLGKSSGGPQDIEWLYDKDYLTNDFDKLTMEILSYETVLLEEGKKHSGEAEVIRMVATKLINKL